MGWKTVFDTVVGVTIVATLILAIVAYFDAQHANRVLASINYLGRYGSNPLLESAIDLAGAYNSEEAKALMKAQPQDDLSGWAERTLQFNKKHNLTKKVLFMAYYFNDVHDCVQHQFCELGMFTTSRIMADVATLYVMSKSLLEEINSEEQWSWNPGSGTRTTGSLGYGLIAFYKMLPPPTSDAP